MIGLCGASGVGKTTLAQAMTHELEGFHYCETSTSGVFKELGLDPSVAMDFDQRMDVQDAILNRLRSEWHSYLGDNAFTDRTPLDLIAYTLADVDSYDALTPDQEHRLETYIGSCIGVYANLFDKIVFVPAMYGITVEPTDKVRPNMTFGYRFKSERPVRSLLSQFGIAHMEIQDVDLGTRVAKLAAFAKDA